MILVCNSVPHLDDVVSLGLLLTSANALLKMFQTDQFCSFENQPFVD